MSDEPSIFEKKELTRAERKRLRNKVRKKIKLAENKGIEIIDPTDDIYRDLAKYHAVPIGELGSGSHASVYLISIKGKNYACKVFGIERFERANDMDLGSAIPDMAFSTLLKHPLIIETREVLLSYQTTWEDINKTPQFIYLIMEIGDKSLEEELDLENLKYTQREAFIYQIGTALKYISSMGLVHCDVKSANIIIKDGLAKLADFGIMRLKENHIENFCQTPGFKAPEIFYNTNHSNYEKKYSKKLERWKRNQTAIELWSFGVTCLELLYSIPNIFTRADRVVDKEFKSNPELSYSGMILNRVLMDRLVETDDVYGEIIKMFGSPGKDAEDVMRKVCEMLLQPDQDKRIAGYDEFLNSHPIRIHHIPQFDSFLNQRIHLPIIHNIGIGNVNKVVSWLFEINDAYLIPHFVLFNTIELFLRVGLKYAKNLQEVQLTAIACLYITASIHHKDGSDGPFSIKALLEICDDTYTDLDTQNKILEIMAGEKGRLIIDSIYYYLSDYETMTGAMFYLTNIEEYLRRGGLPQELALRLYQHQRNGVFTIEGKPNYKKEQHPYFVHPDSEDRKTILKRLDNPSFKDPIDLK